MLRQILRYKDKTSLCWILNQARIHFTCLETDSELCYWKIAVGLLFCFLISIVSNLAGILGVKIQNITNNTTLTCILGTYDNGTFLHRRLKKVKTRSEECQEEQFLKNHTLSLAFDSSVSTEISSISSPILISLFSERWLVLKRRKTINVEVRLSFRTSRYYIHFIPDIWFGFHFLAC